MATMMAWIPESQMKMPQKLTIEHLRFMGIGQRFWPAARTDLSPEQADALKNYLGCFEENIRKGTGVYLWGDNGIGKSFMAAVLCKAAFGLYRVASYCVTATELREAWSEDQPASEDATETVLQRVHRVRFLVIDDIGKEHRAASGFSETKFGAIIRYRSRRQLVTCLTSNFSPTEFYKVYGRATMDLVNECMDTVTFTGPDRRSVKYRAAIG
jgi:DNA replication protein DnaC